jgi:hypothetical protein
MCCCNCGCSKAEASVSNGEAVMRVEPIYVADREALVRALTKAEQAGQLDALKRRFK